MILWTKLGLFHVSLINYLTKVFVFDNGWWRRFANQSITSQSLLVLVWRRTMLCAEPPLCSSLQNLTLPMSRLHLFYLDKVSNIKTHTNTRFQVRTQMKLFKQYQYYQLNYVLQIFIFHFTIFNKRIKIKTVFLSKNK